MRIGYKMSHHKDCDKKCDKKSPNIKRTPTNIFMSNLIILDIELYIFDNDQKL